VADYLLDLTKKPIGYFIGGRLATHTIACPVCGKPGAICFESARGAPITRIAHIIELTLTANKEPTVSYGTPCEADFIVSKQLRKK
jgi:hypothetical protein